MSLTVEAACRVKKGAGWSKDRGVEKTDFKKKVFFEIGHIIASCILTGTIH